MPLWFFCAKSQYWFLRLIKNVHLHRHTHTLSLFPSELNRKRNYSGQKQDESSKLNSKITNSILRLPSAGKG